MSRRVNARIDEDLAEKLAEIERLTGQGTSAIIKQALDAYIEQVRAKAVDPTQALGDFIGCAEGEPDLSSHYKEKLRDSWGKKT